MALPHFVIRSSVDGHLVCFHFGALMNIHVQVFTCGQVFSFLLCIYLGVESLGHMVTLHIFLSICPTCQGSYYYPCFIDKGGKALKGEEIAQDHRARELFGPDSTQVV